MRRNMISETLVLSLYVSPDFRAHTERPLRGGLYEIQSGVLVKCSLPPKRDALSGRLRPTTQRANKAFGFGAIKKGWQAQPRPSAPPPKDFPDLL